MFGFATLTSTSKLETRRKTSGFARAMSGLSLISIRQNVGRPSRMMLIRFASCQRGYKAIQNTYIESAQGFGRRTALKVACCAFAHCYASSTCDTEPENQKKASFCRVHFC